MKFVPSIEHETLFSMDEEFTINGIPQKPKTPQAVKNKFLNARQSLDTIRSLIQTAACRIRRIDEPRDSNAKCEGNFIYIRSKASKNKRWNVTLCKIVSNEGDRDLGAWNGSD